jgi:hypothetical protein
VDVLVRKDFSPRDIELAELQRLEFRRNRYTSGSAHLDDMIALEKALVLCDSHARKFKPRQAHYALHPAQNMRRVQGNCDVCKMFGMATLFLHESQAMDERRKAEEYRRNAEYAHIVAQ